VEFVQYPDRSGWPSGVRGGVYAFVAAPFVFAADGACPAAGIAATKARAAVIAANALNETRIRRAI
jgi:hypothetical protein